MNHIPVLLKEVIEILNPQSGNFFIDGTIGSGGHTDLILKKILPDGVLLAIDWDKESLTRVKKRIEAEFRIYNSKFKIYWIHGNYADLSEILKQKKLGMADGLLLDLGMSSDQLEHSGKGFSFLKDEPLDMRYNTEISMTAMEVVNSFNEQELASIFWKYGEERFSRRIAKKIIEERKKKEIKTTLDLVEVILKAIFNNKTSDALLLKSIFKTLDVQRLKICGRIHPATRVFQALRIYINDELGNLEKLLKNLAEILKPGGRTVIISFHSLEDRLVKNYFREMVKQEKAKILTKKPIRPTFEEIQINPRSRSAKLRAIIFN